MIILENRLTEVFDQLPAIDGFKPVYKWGNTKHLNAIIKMFSENNKTPYPLIYQLSETSVQDTIKNEASARLVLIVACQNTDVSLLNENRWAMSYQNILYPMVANIEKCFDRSGVTQWDGQYTMTNYPNYGNDATTENPQIDIWDAVRIELTNPIIINNRCIHTIKF